MKTNAHSKTITKAVENVSAAKYEGNVIFRKTPEKMTKTVTRFTVRTKDAHKPGSIMTKNGQLQAKANWDVHQDIMNEIFKLDPRAHIYVDTVYGRQHNTNPETVDAQYTEPVEQEEQPRTKRKYTKRTTLTKTSPKNLNKVLSAIKYLAAHPELIGG